MNNPTTPDDLLKEIEVQAAELYSRMHYFLSKSQEPANVDIKEALEDVADALTDAADRVRDTFYTYQP